MTNCCKRPILLRVAMKTKDVAKIKLFIFLFFLVAASVHVYYCWRAVASQPTILYNSGIWPKYVGCKIVDLRSPMRSLYPGACGLGDMRSRFLHTPDMKESTAHVS